MPSESRFILDTNVIVSAFLIKSSIARQSLDAALELGKVLISRETAEELYDVLRRPSFDKYLREEERNELMTALVREAVLVQVTSQVEICRDKSDDKFLALAIDGKATCIITGDLDLLSLRSFEGIPINTPKAFLDWAQRTQS